ncbi:MAG: helix-turn-helix domain-containing protein [Acidobacteriota bacterium]
MPSATNNLPPDLEITAHNRNEHFASALLGVDVETLRGWRKRKTGPPWRKVNGRLVRYSLGELTEWVKSQPSGGGGR